MRQVRVLNMFQIDCDIEQVGIDLRIDAKFKVLFNFSDEDEDFKKQVQQLRESMPFAVVGANAMVEIKGKKMRGRQYPWGIVEVENPAHCDFVKLRTMLITHMQDLQVK